MAMDAGVRRASGVRDQGERGRPRVTLIEGDAGERPFASPQRWRGAPGGRVEEHGYRVDEFGLRGRARAHVRDSADAPRRPWGDPVPYATRVLVARPRDAAAFRGRVVVELLNATLGADFSMVWSDLGRTAMADGDVFVGLTFQSVPVDALRAVDPERYGGLRIDGDELAWDIIADALDVVGDEGRPLLPDCAPVRSVLVCGGSQSGSYVRSFVGDGFHRPATEDRRASADGYLILVAASGFGEFGVVPSPRPPTEGRAFLPEAAPLDHPQRRPRGLEVPVVDLMSEVEAPYQVSVDRGDGDAAQDRYRLYQIPGRSHTTGLLAWEGLAADGAALDGSGEGERFLAALAPREDWHPESEFLLAGVVDAMRRWQEDGIPMPPSARVELEVDEDAGWRDDGWFPTGIRPVRDERGHTRGGIRYPTIVHPVQRFVFDDAGGFLPPCYRAPWRASEVARVYGSSDAWLAAATAEIDRLVEERFVRPDHRERFAALLRALAPRDDQEGSGDDRC